VFAQLFNRSKMIIDDNSHESRHSRDTAMQELKLAGHCDVYCILNSMNTYIIKIDKYCTVCSHWVLYGKLL
jgi:hypothetical protein